jgi:type III secretion protein C
MNNRRQTALALCTLLFCVLRVCAGEAAELHWKNKPYQIVANEKKLADFIRELTASQGVTAVVDTKVEGTISGKFSGPAENILNMVCGTYGLTWYYDGSFIYIDPVAEAKSEVFAIPSGSAARLAATLQRMQIVDRRYPLSIRETENTVFVSGPKRYVELVRQAAHSLDAQAQEPDRAEIKVFPLKYAWVSDFRINRSGKEVTVPGVATTLRNLYSRGRQAAFKSPIPSSQRSAPTRRMRMRTGEMMDMPAKETSNPPVDDGRAASIFGWDSPPGAPEEDRLPQFEADTRMNAVLVRDLPERMSKYERLISALDVKPRLIEIELFIMDISSDSLDSLGIDWRLHDKHGDLQFGRGNAPPLTFDSGTTEAGQTGPTTPIGAVLSLSIGDDLRRYLLARVRALAQSGEAEFVARPKVLALDNTEAVLENLSEFFVRVQGFQDAGLFNIVTGTSVRVTPLIIDEKSGMGVMMSIDIDDGNLTAQSVDQIPVILRRTVLTQAMVEEGKSLLIAGFNSEEKQTIKAGVPLLSAIPVLGNLFKYTDKTRKHMERFYMLTPRLGAAAIDNGRIGVSEQP